MSEGGLLRSASSEAVWLRIKSLMWVIFLYSTNSSSAADEARPIHLPSAIKRSNSARTLGKAFKWDR